MSGLSRFFEKDGLIPVVCQNEETLQVLMLGFANEEALRLTVETGTAWFWSRSRQKLWNKGESSGNFLYVSRILTDCDDDSVLLLCRPAGPTCHTGSESCFFNEIASERNGDSNG